MGHDAHALVQIHQRDGVRCERAELVGWRTFDSSHAIDRADAGGHLPPDAIAVAVKAMVAWEELRVVAIGAALEAQFALVAAGPEMLGVCVH